MRLFVVLSIIAYSYGAKLDRTYLPPPGAGSSGGSPGSLVAPNQGFGDQPARLTNQYQPSNFGQASQGSPSQRLQERPQGQYQSPQNYQGSANDSPRGFAQSIQNPVSQYSAEPQQGFDQGVSTSAQAFGGAPNANYQEPKPDRAQAESDRNAEILKYVNENDGERFMYSFETSNGISAEEAGEATNGVRAEGGFAYTGDDGNRYSITYTADENGYRPTGDHLPTPPPIPEAILRSIEKNAQAKAAGTQEGAYDENENYSQGQSQQLRDGSQGNQFNGYSNNAQPIGPQGPSRGNPGAPSKLTDGRPMSARLELEEGPTSSLEEAETVDAAGSQPSNSAPQGQSQPGSGYQYNQPGQGNFNGRLGLKLQQQPGFNQPSGFAQNAEPQRKPFERQQQPQNSYNAPLNGNQGSGNPAQNQYNRPQSPKTSANLQSAPYQYNPPTGPSQRLQNPSFGNNQPQKGNFGSANQSQGKPSSGFGQNFPGPQQKPSFNSQEGYKY